MKSKQLTEYQTPEAEVIRAEQEGLLCSSTGFGTASTDDFTIGEDISSNF